MDLHHDQDFFIPGLELMSLTGDCDDLNQYAEGEVVDNDEPMIEWLEDSELQENLFQIIPLTPEEARCDKDNHIIQTDQHVFFEELGYFCEEPEPIDPYIDYEADYKERMDRQQQQLLKNGRARANQRQQHVDLASIPSFVADPVTRMNPMLSPSPSIDAVTSPGLSSSSSSFHHTDDDHSEEDDFRSPLYLSRQSHINPRHHHANHQHHHLYHPSPISKPVLPSHFSFTTARF